MNRYEILLKGTHGREVRLCVQARNILEAWKVADEIKAEIAYIGAVYSVNIKEL